MAEEQTVVMEKREKRRMKDKTSRKWDSQMVEKKKKKETYREQRLVEGLQDKIEKKREEIKEERNERKFAFFYISFTFEN